MGWRSKRQWWTSSFDPAPADEPRRPKDLRLERAFSVRPLTELTVLHIRARLYSLSSSLQPVVQMSTSELLGNLVKSLTTNMWWTRFLSGGRSISLSHSTWVMICQGWVIMRLLWLRMELSLTCLTLALVGRNVRDGWWALPHSSVSISENRYIDIAAFTE